MGEAVKLLRRISEQLDDISPNEGVGVSDGCGMWIELATVDEIRTAADASPPDAGVGRLPRHSGNGGWTLDPDLLLEVTKEVSYCGWSGEMEAVEIAMLEAEKRLSAPSPDTSLVEALKALLAAVEMTTFSDQFPSEYEMACTALAHAEGRTETPA